MAENLEQLAETVLYRIGRGDVKGRPFGTPGNPRPPTLAEFNPRIVEIEAGQLGTMIVERRHGIFAEQAELIGRLTDAESTRFRPEDPISARKLATGLSLTGGHHRVNEITQRVRTGRLDSHTLIAVLYHD